MEAYCLSVPAGSTSGEVQPLLQGLKSRTSKASSPPQAPVLPPAGIPCECQTTPLSLTFLIWEMGPRVATMARWVWSSKKRYWSFSSPRLIFIWSRGPHCLVGGQASYMRKAFTEPLFCVECALNPSEFRGMLEKLGMREFGLSPRSFLFFFFNQYINISLSTCPCQDEHCFRGKKMFT